MRSRRTPLAASAAGKAADDALVDRLAARLVRLARWAARVRALGRVGRAEALARVAGLDLRPARRAGGPDRGFARVHQTLRVTPLMEAKVADHVWTVEKIVRLLDGSRHAGEPKLPGVGQ